MRDLDRLQVRAFYSLYKARLSSLGSEMAFITAITDTSDNVFGEAMLNHPDLIEEWIKKYSNPRKNQNEQ